MSLSNVKTKVRSAMKHYPMDYMLLILIAWVLPALYGLFNRYFIGYMSYESIVTEQSFEALEVIMEVFLEMFPLSVMALVAKKMTDTKSIISIVKTGFILQAIITVAFVIVNFFLSPYLIDWINTPASSQALALDYFRLRACTLPFSTLSALMIISIKAMRKGWSAIAISFFSLLINYILDVLFISNYPFSLKLGLMGSAWNNVIANMCLLAISGLYFLRLVKASPKFEYDVKSSKYIVGIGKWNGLESLVRNLGYIIGVVAVVNFIGQYEPDAIGGYNTAMWVMWGITLIPVSAWVEATQVAIGNAYGQSDLQAMKDIQKISTLILTLYMIAWIFLGWAFWLPISRWLNQGVSDSVAWYSMLTFMYLIWPYILYTVGQGLKTVFIGTGRPQYVLIPSAIVNIFIYLPLGLLVKYSGIAVSYTQFLTVTISVFALDFAFICYYLWKKGYTLDFHAFE